MEGIMVHSTLIQRSGKVDSSSQPCRKIQGTSSKGVEHFRGMGTSIQEMSCHSPTISRLSFSMSGVSTTWDRFQNKKNYEYILVVVDYVSKWVEAIPCRATDAKNSKKMFEETIFP
jgi:hypothetical protein